MGVFKKLFGKKVSKKQGQPDVYADWGHRYIIHNVERADSGMWDTLGEYPEPEEDFYEKALQEAHEVFEKGDFTVESAHMIERFVLLKAEELRLNHLRESRLRRARDAAVSRADKQLMTLQYGALQEARKKELGRLEEEIAKMEQTN